VNPDVGLPGPAAFVLPYTAEWLLDPTPTTTTTTTSTSTTTAGGGSTTSTTLGGCAGDAECADSDPCTDDVCNAGACSNPPLAGAAGADCELGQALAGPICNDAIDPTLQAAITKFIGKARTAVQAFDAAPAKKMKKLRTKATKALSTLLKKANKAAKKNKISAECQADIAALIAQLRTLVGAL
jgi:hypothetical protein